MAMEQRRLLESWKEISVYLKRSEKTCRRFEISLGLPVHRLDGTPRARVFAYTDELDRWLGEKLNHVAEEVEKTEIGRGRKRILLVSGAIALVVLAVGAVLIWHPFSSAPGPLLPRNPSLAVLPFDNPARDTSLEPWRTALADLAITDLVQSRYVNVVRITDLYRALIALKLGEAEGFSDEAVKTVADKVRADFVATGSLVREGSDVVLTVLVHNPGTGTVAEPIRASYREERDLFSTVDGLTKKMKRALNLSPRHVSRDIDRSVADISTASPQAFLLFSRGYRLGGIRKYNETIPVFIKSIEIDPKFALAYKYLYRSCQNELREDEAKRNLLEAVRWCARLSERERGELLWLYYDGIGRDEAKKTKAMERLCDLYPDDRFGSMQLLGVYGGLEDWDKALPVAERAWAVNKTEINICRSLAQCYENLGLADKAVSVLTEFIDSNPASDYFPVALSLRANCYLRQGKYEAALGDIDRLITRHPNRSSHFVSRGVVELYRQDFAGAERDFRRLLGQSDPFLRIEALMCLRDLFLSRGMVEKAKEQLLLSLEIAGRIEGDRSRVLMETTPIHQELAYLHRLAGQLPEASKEIEAALRDYQGSSAAESGPSLSLLRLKALILLDMGHLEEFDQCLEEVRRDVERENKPRLMRVYYHLLGHRELRDNNVGAAFEHFQRSLDLVSVPGHGLGADPEYFYSLAETYARYEGGIYLTRTIGAFERIMLPTVNRLHCGDLYARSLFQLAKLYDRSRVLGEFPVDQAGVYRSRAVECYRKFIALWENADPMFRPEVEEARTRLAVLEAKDPPS